VAVSARLNASHAARLPRVPRSALHPVPLERRPPAARAIGRRREGSHHRSQCGSLVTGRDWHSNDGAEAVPIQFLRALLSRVSRTKWDSEHSKLASVTASAGRAAPNPRGAALHLIAAPMFLS